MSRTIALWYCHGASKNQIRGAKLLNTQNLTYTSFQEQLNILQTYKKLQNFIKNLNFWNYSLSEQIMWIIIDFKTLFLFSTNISHSIFVPHSITFRMDTLMVVTRWTPEICPYPEARKIKGKSYPEAWKREMK